MDKRMFKKTGDELQDYLSFKRRGFMKPVKKGKGSKYNRHDSNKEAFAAEFQENIPLEYFDDDVS